MDKELTEQLAQLEPEVRLALTNLTDNLRKVETIQDYQQIEQQVFANQKLRRIQQDLKHAQKQIVGFTRIDKPKAAAVARKKADALSAQLEHDPLTLAYRQSLTEANETLEYVTKRLERKIQTMMAQEDQ